MTRKICINQNYFGKSIGYGLWGLMTIGILILLIASTLEVNSIYKTTNDNDHFDCDYRYNKIFDDDYGTCLDIIEYTDKNGWVHYRQYYGILFAIIDCIGIGLWIYYKQQTFKFSWCNKYKSVEGI